MRRPTLPMFSHERGEWFYDGVFYKDGEEADHLFHIAMLDYASTLEVNVASLLKALRGMLDMVTYNRTHGPEISTAIEAIVSAEEQ